MSASRANRYSVLNAAQKGGSIGNTIMGLVIVIIVISMLYYLYNWLYSSTVNGATVILGNHVAANGMTTPQAAAKVLPTITDNGQYTASFWVYVTDTKGLGETASLLSLLDISVWSAAATPVLKKTLLFVGLNPKNAAIVVRQNNSNETEFTMSDIIANYNGANTQYKSNDRCDIINGIEYQRWVLISVIANSRTLDVYIDGKLARSCVYKGGYSINPLTTDAIVANVGLNNNGNLKGYFSYANFYSYAMTPAEVWMIYQQGPRGPTSILQLLSNFFNITATINGTDINSMNPCSTCTKPVSS